MAAQHSIIFVACGALSTIHAEPVRPYLEDASYDFVSVALPSADIREPRATYEGDVQAILDALQSAQSPGITLILHSYAGIPGREAANRFLAAGHSQLQNIILVAALGKTSPAAMAELGLDGAVQHKAGYNHIQDPAANAFSDLAAEQAKPFVEAVRPQTIPLPTEEFWEQSTSEAWKAVKTACIVSLKDRLLKVSYQEEAEKEGGKVFKEEWDHCPQISHPEKFAQLVKSIIES